MPQSPRPRGPRRTSSPRILGFGLLALHLLAGCTEAGLSASAAGDDQRSLTVLLVLDGLRPDYVTPERMPRLAQLRAEGVWGTAHHAVFPTLTRVNAPSISTGVRPGKHGLMENAIYVPELPEGSRIISTGDAESLMAAEAAIGAPLRESPDLAEILAPHGRRLMVASSGSSGSAYLLNSRTPTGPIFNTDLVLPDSLEDVVLSAFGPAPPAGRPNLERNRRAVDVLLDLGLERVQPHVILMWLSDPDHTAHAEGVGTPTMLESLTAVDQEVGRLLDTLAARGWGDRVNLILTSDHGFSTHVGTVSLERFLVDRGLKRAADSEEVVVAGGAIHVREGGQDRVLAIANALQAEDWVGAVFSRGASPEDAEGWVPGTLSYAAIRYDHRRAPDLYVSANWSDALNELGWPGTSWQMGTAGHGTSSPWDIRATLLAHGPAFKSGVEITLPTGHQDLAPTVLHLQGVPVPSTMEGRVLEELLRDGPTAADSEVVRGTNEVIAPIPGGTVRTTLNHARFRGSYYVTGTATERGP
jgi:hypothetical protein